MTTNPSCQTLNAPPAGVSAYLVAGSSTTMLAEGLPDGARLEFAAVADGPVLLSLEGVEGDAATAFELSAGQVDDLIARRARYIRIVTGDGDTLHVLAAGRVWERSGWSGECGRTQVVTRLVAGPPGPKGDPGADSTVPGPKGDPGADSTVPGPKGDPGEPGSDGRGIESITDDDADGIATVLYTDGASGELPLPHGPQGDPGPRGDTGDKGEQGEAGPQGVQGEIGPIGPQGDAGPIGPKGDPGPIGPQGLKGDKGDPGALADASSYILTGPGRPDTPATTGGIIAGSEPVGAEYRSTDGAGVGAWVWMKRPTGWAVTDGDTGWRSITPSDKSTVTDGSILLRRRNDVVQVRFVRLTFTNGGSAELWNPVPVGFQVYGSMSVIAGSTATVASIYAPVLGVWWWTKSGSPLTAALTPQTTDQPWPTTLPGRPA